MSVESLSPGAKTGRPTVLVVDDEAGNVELLQRTLRRQYEVLSAASGEQALGILRAHPDVALILTDQRMPGLTGVDVLRESLRIAPEAVRIVFTGYTEFQDVLDAINLGHVSRFVLKPIEPDKLVNLVKDALEVYFLNRERNYLLGELETKTRRLEEHEKELERLVAERTAELHTRNAELRVTVGKLEEANTRLSELALRDGLTGLYNHRYFQERMAAEVARSRRHNHPVTLLFLDIDHFKTYNDSYGHPAGDEVLKMIATLLVQGSRMGDIVARVRSTDVVARYGGEEFAIILPETSGEGAVGKAEHIRRSVADHKFPASGDATTHVTVSIGVAAYPAEAVDAPTLIRRADKALYRAKQNGRNRVESIEGPPEP